MQNRNLVTFAERLKAARKQRLPKVTQAAVAKAGGIKQSSYSELETGESRAPMGPTLVKMAKFLKVRPEWLMSGALPMQADGEPAEQAPMDDVESDELFAKINGFWRELPPWFKRKVVSDATELMKDLMESKRSEYEALQERLGMKIRRATNKE